MKKASIKNLQGIEIRQVEMLDPIPLINKCVEENTWGLGERWVWHKDEIGTPGYDEADVLEEREVQLYPAIEGKAAVEGKPAVLDENGNILEPEVLAEAEVLAQPAVMRKEVKLRAEYTIEIVDITAQIEQEKINQEALAYLVSTDWLVIRQMDSGEPMPEDVKAKRAEARAKIVK